MVSRGRRNPVQGCVVMISLASANTSLAIGLWLPMPVGVEPAGMTPHPIHEAANWWLAAASWCT